MTRPSKHEMMMQIAEVVKVRSSCSRLQVGCIVSNFELTRILAIGYNGMEAGGKNECDSRVPGNCGCIHAEVNALIKVTEPGDKVVFVTTAPCLTCARLMVNAGVIWLYYHRPYRDTSGVELLIKRDRYVEQI